MAGSKSNYLANKVINLLLGGTAYSVPSSLWVALWDSSDGELTDSSTGGSAGEISGNGYARVEISNDTTTWGSDTTNGVRTNAISVTFPTATGAWGSTSVDQVAILDASSAGNILFWADLNVPKVVTSGDSLKFDSGDLILTET